MSQDAKNSLILVGSVTVFFGLFWLSLALMKRFDLPELPTWVLAIPVILGLLEFGWMFVQVFRRRYQPRRTEKAGDA